MMRLLAPFAAALAVCAAPLQLAQAQPQTMAATEAPPSAPARELMVPVEGGRIYVRIDGDLESGPLPAVFIHGGPGGTHNHFVEALGLADQRAVILYDQLDSGMSDQPNDPANWRVERFVEELEAIRKTLGIERWHLVGHSWGSALALEYAARYPQHTASTVLGGTYISTPLWIEDANLLLEQLPEQTRQTVAACESEAPPPADTCEAAVGAFYSRFNGREPPSATLKAYSRGLRERGGRGFNPVLYNAMWGPSEFRAKGSLVDYDAVPLLSKVDGRHVLFMIGQYDEAMIDTVQEFVALAPGAELAVIPGAAHGFISDRPAESVAILRGWLARNDMP